MENSRPSSPRKAAAARKNGNLGGTKDPDRSRWSAFDHGLNAKRLTILEGKHLPEYSQYTSWHAELLKALSPLTVEDVFAIDKFIADAWRLRRAFRFELSETEKTGNGMSSPAMNNVIRYTIAADRQFEKSYARIKAIFAEKKKRVPNCAAALASDARGGEESRPTAADRKPDASGAG